MKKRTVFERGFTLVELLIVIALIAILSVAVLATINPIEQSNKARDSRVQNDAAEVLNAYERYYSSKQHYPWEEFTNGGTEGAIGANDEVVLRSDTYGFGICSDQNNQASLISQDPLDAPGSCTTGTYANLLIQTSELKSSFAGKDEFQPVIAGTATGLTQAMWVVRAVNADSLYVCYVPKAKANREDTTKMRCITTAGVVQQVGTGSCVAAVTANWTVDPSTLIATTPTAAVFRCVPE